MNKTRRLFIFASYDPDGIVDPYVVYYLRKLQELGDIIFVADYEPKDYEEAVLLVAPFTMYTSFKRHGEYDFGSYKIGYEIAVNFEWLDDYDYLYFVNDSMYAPLYPLKDIFETFEDLEIDVWGFTKNTRTKVEHIQSYFVGISKRAREAVDLKGFLDTVEHKDDKQDIVHTYEFGLSKLFTDAGFTLFSFFNDDKEFNLDPHQPIFARMVELGYPFIKKRMLTGGLCGNIPKALKALQRTNYDKNLILNNIERIDRDE